MQIEPGIGAAVERLADVAAPPGAVVLASSRLVNETIRALAVSIQPWVDLVPESPVVLVGLLQGGKFYADRLSQELRGLCLADFSRADIKISTRDGDGRALSSPKVVGDLDVLQGRRVLVIDDILDSGATLRIVRERIGGIAADLKTTVLIQKNDPQADHADRPVADFVGLTFSDARWFSGAGMDMPGDPEGKARDSALIIAYPPVF